MFELITGEAPHAPRPHFVPLAATTAAHVALVAAVVALPALWLSQQLPDVPSMMAFVAVPPAPPPPPPPPAPASARKPAKTEPVTANPAAAPLEAPSQIEPEPPAKEGEGGVPGGVEGGVPGGVVGGVLGGIPTPEPLPPPPPPPPPPAPKGPVRVGGQIQTPTLVHRVEPVYPGIAVSARLEGMVILEAIVDQEGRVAEVRVLRSAGGLLDREALIAVRQWRYSPLVLNGIKERFILTVTLSFRLQNAPSAS